MNTRRIAVAWSGGRDSTALLHATLAAAAGQDIEVLALHVHHGLSPHADAWQAHCAAQCRRWARAGKPVRFVAQRVTSAPAPGESLEAWARTARYAALRALALAHATTVVLLAHHLRDQAETFLLQALRGGGTAGLSAMPVRVERDGICWERPWLGKPRAEIDAYVRRHRLRHIEDDSNLEPRLARNRLRLQVWPALLGAFAQADGAFAQAAQWAQQADAVLREVAALDLAALAPGSELPLTGWQALSVARRGNLLRAWVARETGAAPSAALLTRLLAELPVVPRLALPWQGCELRLYRGVLRCVTPDAAPADLAARETRVAIQDLGRYELPGWQGRLVVSAAAGEGVPLAWLAHAELRSREGGERFQAGPGRPPRSLKKQYQAASLPTWRRQGPLVYSGGQLVYVPGLGLDARVVGLPGQPLVTLDWQAGTGR